MGDYFDGRSGLGKRMATATRVGVGDLNQMADSLLAAKRVYGSILGGEGI